MNEFLAGSCLEPEGIACLPGGHGKAQEIGNKIGLELMGMEKATSLSATSSLSLLLWGAGDGPKRGALVTKGILSAGSPGPL